MSKKKLGGLGRGLDALINPKAQEGIYKPVDIAKPNLHTDDGASYDVLAMVETNRVAPNPYQPRTEFDPKALAELKQSISQNGLIQPITVRRKGNKEFE
ncbi:MAG: ParB N-terminal domain-containing protein, partial [Melioribacteraceae bacterium]